MIIAGDRAMFGQPEIKLGTIPGCGGTQRLIRAVGKAKAMDLILTGRMMKAEEAERAGLVARIVDADKLVDEAVVTAATIATYVICVGPVWKSYALTVVLLLLCTCALEQRDCVGAEHLG
jgi:enoyl-CoA hydratase/carnithine racemase